MKEILDNQTIKFLSRHGYLENILEDEVDPIDFNVSQLTGDMAHMLQGKETLVEQGLMHLQAFYGLDPTGELDAVTAATVKIPRCTNKDLPVQVAVANKAEFNLGRSWNKNSLTWRVYKGPSNDLGEERVRQTLRRAFSVWSKHADLSFTEDLERTPDIKISFESGDHQDGDAFDAAGGTLAHAFFPGQGSISGDIHFDDDEMWTLGSYSGVNLTQVAVHEIGHSLGLEHTRVRGAIMFPSYEGYKPNLDLAQDDIAGIQALYGPPQGGGGVGGGEGRELEPEEEWLPGVNNTTLINTISEICTKCSIQ